MANRPEQVTHKGYPNRKIYIYEIYIHIYGIYIHIYIYVCVCVCVCVCGKCLTSLLIRKVPIQTP